MDEISYPPIGASHVCRSWREALLSDPTMWTCIVVPKIDKGQTEEFLLRSGSASLNVFVDKIGELDTHALASVMQEIHRFRVLEVDILGSRGVRTVHQTLSSLEHPAPRLEYLAFHVYALRFLEDQAFPRTLFSGNTPNLRHVYLYLLEGFQRYFSSPLFQNLSEIQLQICHTTLVSSDAFFDAFEQCPHLRILGIHATCHKPTASLSTLSRRQVHLPHLQRLSLQAFYVEPAFVAANFVFQSLIFPLDNLEFDIRIHGFHPERFGVESLSQLLVQQRYTQLSLEFTTKDTVDVLFSDPKNDRSFATKYDINQNTVDSLIDFLRMFVLSDITYLYLGYAPFNATMLMDLFSSLKKLEHLHIDHGIPSDFSDVSDSPQTSFLMALMAHARMTSNPTTQFSSNDGLHPSDADGTMLCPSLNTLEIEVYPDDDFKLDESYAEMISNYADFRRQAGRSFKAIKVTIVKAMLGEEALVQLRSLEGFSFTDLTDDWLEVLQYMEKKRL